MMMILDKNFSLPSESQILLFLDLKILGDGKSPLTDPFAGCFCLIFRREKSRQVIGL